MSELPQTTPFPSNSVRDETIWDPQIKPAVITAAGMALSDWNAPGDITQTTGLPVAGYKKTQPQWALDLVNENKVLEEKILRQIDIHVALGANLDGRAVALARTGIQEAFMWLNRAVFQPERLKGDLK